MHSKAPPIIMTNIKNKAVRTDPNIIIVKISCRSSVATPSVMLLVELGSTSIIMSMPPVGRGLVDVWCGCG